MRKFSPVALFNDGVWISAFWNDYRDTYQNSNDEPFLYRPMPASPKGALRQCPICDEFIKNPLDVYKKMEKGEIIESEDFRKEFMTEPEKIRFDYHDRRNI